MALLSDELAALVQRTGSNTGKLRTERQRAAFSANARADLASIIYQFNTVYKPLVETLSSTVALNALDFGLSGNVIFTNIAATAASADAYWDSTNIRVRTIKETVDVLLSEISRLENAIDSIGAATSYDDTAVRNLIATNSFDLQQLAEDTMGPNYTLDGDAAPNLTYALSQIIDAMGANFTGYVATGNTYVSTYPALSFSVLLSNVTIDTTLAQSVITNLSTDLTAIRDFVGMAGVADTTLYGSNNFVTDTNPLDLEIGVLDAALATHGARHINGGADPIDGDQLDITYAPANYTRSTVPTEVTLVEHLTAHLAGIDNVIGSLGGAGNWQGTYTVGPDAAVLLDATIGGIEIRQDAGATITELMKFQDSAGGDKIEITSDYIRHRDSSSVYDDIGVTPAVIATTARVYGRPDADSGLVELWTVGDGGDAQITRDGRIREPIVASQTYSAAEMIPESNQEDAGASQVPSLNYGGSGFCRAYPGFRLGHGREYHHYYLGPSGRGWQLRDSFCSELSHARCWGSHRYGGLRIPIGF